MLGVICRQVWMSFFALRQLTAALVKGDEILNRRARNGLAYDFQREVIRAFESDTAFSHIKLLSAAVAEAMDRINDKYGEFVITPALMMGMDETILDRITFGDVKELEELYQQ
jgi:hypothetical protein